jgi:hypothetical protein
LFQPIVNEKKAVPVFRRGYIISENGLKFFGAVRGLEYRNGYNSPLMSQYRVPRFSDLPSI